MKRFLLVFLMLCLFGCENEKIIEVNYTDTGYTSELIGTIDLSEGYTTHADCESDKYCIRHISNNGVEKIYEIDFLNKQISEIENKEIKDEYIWHQSDDFTIYYKREYINMNEVTLKTTYYYEKNNQRSILYEDLNVVGNDDELKLKTFTDSVTGEYCFGIRKDNIISINAVRDGKLVEIDQIEINKDGYVLKNYYTSENGYNFKYENDDEIRFITNDEETIIKKDIEDDLKLINFNSLNYYVYENEKIVKCFYQGEEKVVDKNVDSYELINYNFYSDVYVYEKDDTYRLVIDENTYDLGKNATYIIKDDYVLSTYTSNEKELGKESIVIDRKTNEIYKLSKYIDLREYSNFKDNYILDSYVYSLDYPYSILKVEDLNFTLIQLPFDYSASVIEIIDEKTIAISCGEDGVISYYLVTIQ